jgi:hypothetical protein
MQFLLFQHQVLDLYEFLHRCKAAFLQLNHELLQNLVLIDVVQKQELSL